MIEPDPPVRLEEAPALPAVPLRPECECGEVRRPADRRPGVHILLVLEIPSVELLREVDEQLAVWREVAALLIDPAVEPVAGLEGVRLGVPPDQLHPLARPPAED